jgi:hypothetical protein
MNRELAKHIVITGFHSMSEVTNLLPLLQAHCSPEEYSIYRKAIADIAGTIVTEVLNPIFTWQPGLEQEIQASVEKYSKIF